MDVPEFGGIEKGISYTERPGAYGFLLNELEHLAVVETPIGLFLPGGGADPGETMEAALSREFFEEIGFVILQSTFVTSAIQYQHSVYYKQYFKKIGSFYEVEAVHQAGAVPAPEHRLLWMPLDAAKRSLSQEFQRWALGQWVLGC